MQGPKAAALTQKSPRPEHLRSEVHCPTGVSAEDSPWDIPDPKQLSNPGVPRGPGVGMYIFPHASEFSGASQVELVVKNPPANAGDKRDEGLIPSSGSSPREGHGNQLQYSCLENPMDRGAWWATVD